MKTRLLHCITGCFLLATILARGQPRSIHLRNEIINTEAASLAAPGTNVNGLFLIQFDGHPQKAWRDELRKAGIDLVKYVPNDAFIARLQNVPAAKLRGFNYVRWFGAYRPEHKIHPRLAALATNAPQPVTIMLSPRATAAEIAQARSFLTSIENQSALRQGIFLRGVLRPGALASVASLDATLWIEPASHRKLIDEAASKIIGGDDGQIATQTVTEQRGLAGQGVTVCVTDTGLDTGDTNNIHPDVAGRVTGFKFYPPLTDGSDGYGHGTHCAGIVAGNAATGETDPNSGQWYGLGVASSADLFIERIFDENANEVSPAPSDSQLAQDGYRNGAQIQSDSWGDDVQGEYDTDASQFDELVRDADSVTPGDQSYILEFSAGNAGPDPQTMDSPASGKNVLATGASENIPGFYAETYDLYADGPDTIADFSSRGPTEDGRIKPDIVAPGTWIASMASSAAPDEAAIAWTVIDNFYVYMGGTSMSGPAAAGAAAEFVQYYKGLHTNALPSPALVKAALINSAVELSETNGGSGPIPNFDEGWGRLAITNLIDSDRNFQMVDQSVLLTTGEIYQQHTFVASPNQPLKITLAYTDVPGFPGAIPALVNDLNLIVIGPDGTVYHGNQFNGDDSTPNATSFDSLNNVEAVNLSQPLVGNYVIEVVAANVVEDARLDTADIDQDFALVVSGLLLKPNQGAILLDRANYTAPGTIHLQALDAGRAGAASVTVQLKSTSEPTPQTVVLQAAGNYGAFTAAVTTVTATPAPAGELTIRNGDTIEADYTDSGAVIDKAFATAVLNPPTISAVSASLNLGVIDLTWVTSEPSSSVVYYGTNRTDLNLISSNATLTVNHSVELGGLIAGKTYYYEVSSVDEAGNSAVNNNSGDFYNFVAVPTPPVLMVDDYDYANEETNGSTVIPASSYTNALTATGYGYAYWNVSDRGFPALGDLLPYRVIIWRTTDDIINYDGTNNTLTLDQQNMIQAYLNNGGGFFMASMGILSELGDVPFRANVLQVAGFNQNPDPPEPCDCDEYTGVPGFTGVAGNQITSNMNVTLDYDNYPSFDAGFGFGDDDTLGPDFGDTFTPSPNATAIAFSTQSGSACGVSYPPPGVDSPGRVVFLSIPLDAIPETGPTPDNETALLLKALEFLDPGGNGVGTVTLNQNIYTIPSQVSVEIGDSALAGSGQVAATFASSSFTNRLTTTLVKTPHAGIFRGGVTLIGSPTNGPGQLQTRNGDLLSATYLDAAVDSNVTASAVIQTNGPIISEVSATTNIGGATITWTTSEPADSTVQYGRGAILDHAAHNSMLVTSHSVTLNSLTPSSLYYYEVTSRDQAGNSATDDNHDSFYTFTTPKTLQPPWFDNLESGALNWTIVPDPSVGDSSPGDNWQLGAPSTPLTSAAHSGVNAWGIPLTGGSGGGDGLGIYSSYLYSPVIDLTGLSQATLTFWDVFDFSQIEEDGVIMISTNTSEPVTDLQPYIDFSGLTADDWEQETNDLTPFVGQTIQIVWYYEGVSLGDPLNGWIIDDVAVTGLGAGSGGTVVVTKNIASGTVTVINPNGASQAVSGLTSIISNTPPGQYIVEYGDVAFYKTPPTQTNTLLASNIISFSGNYTFPDVNNNGISDYYEQFYFGTVTTNRTRLTDTDGDGMSDYEEFIAGTDPTNALSNLKFLSASQANGTVSFQWSAEPGHIYEVDSSTDLFNWTPASPWIQAQTSPMTYTWTNSGTNTRSFRVQVRP